MYNVDLPIFSTFFMALGISKFFTNSKDAVKSDKIILVIDPIDTLIKYKFSFWKFRYIFYKRKYTEEFIFNLGFIYDIFFITDNDLVDKNVYNLIDPLNISCYRSYTTSKKKEINKLKENNRLIILDSKENNLENSINIKSFVLNNESDEKDNLLDVVNFLSTLSFLNVKDYTKTISSYKNKDFFLSFDKIQKKIYKMKNMLNLYSDSKYNEVKNQIYKDKIDNYKYNKDVIFKYKQDINN